MLSLTLKIKFACREADALLGFHVFFFWAIREDARARPAGWRPGASRGGRRRLAMKQVLSGPPSPGRSRWRNADPVRGWGVRGALLVKKLTSKSILGNARKRWKILFGGGSESLGGVLTTCRIVTRKPREALSTSVDLTGALYTQVRRNGRAKSRGEPPLISLVSLG